jgi:hypothetical protein
VAVRGRFLRLPATSLSIYQSSFANSSSVESNNWAAAADGGAFLKKRAFSALNLISIKYICKQST